MTYDQEKLRAYLAHRAALIVYATPIVGCRDRAEDVVQEAYLRFAPDIPAGRRVERPVAYLYRVVRNLALDWARRLSAETRHQHDDPVPWTMPSAPTTPEQAVLHHEELRRVSEALSELPAPARLACEMHRFGGYTLQEIAERLGVSVPTAHRLVRDAVVHVAARLDPPEG